MKSPAQFILILLAALSAFTLSPAKSGVREAVQTLFVPVAMPVRAIGLWVHDRMSPRHEADVLSPDAPRPDDELRRQNAALLTRLAALQAQLDDLKQLSAQYAKLRNDLRQAVQPALVVGGPTGGRGTLTIGTTGLTTVAEKMAVVHPGGMVGQIYGVATGGGTARVLLVTDPASHLYARFVRFVAIGGGDVQMQRVPTPTPLVDGTGRGLIVGGLAAHDVRRVVQVGDVALLDDPAFPPVCKGLRLGTVTRINLPQTDAGHATIELSPTADFVSLHEVLVVNK